MSALLCQPNRKKRRIRLPKSLSTVSVRCCTLILTYRIPCLLNLETFAGFWGLGENHNHIRRKPAKLASSCRMQINSQEPRGLCASSAERSEQVSASLRSAEARTSLASVDLIDI